MRTAPVPLLKLKGRPAELGRQHGAALVNQIHACVGDLLGSFLNDATPAKKDELKHWHARQRALCLDLWPWLDGELQGLSDSTGLSRVVIELYNFRAWQYEIYHASCCSSFCVPDRDGHVITGGTLDDPRHLYAAVHCQPTDGLRHITFPIAGTVWGNRGLNEAGLALGMSSLICSGVTFDTHELVPVDLVFRHLLQFCATVGEVAAYCAKLGFFINVLAVDRHGGVWAGSHYAHEHTDYATPERTAVQTNHPNEPAATLLAARGYTGPDPVLFSRKRHALITEWLNDHAQFQTATGDNARAFLGGGPIKAGRVNNPMTAFATVAEPQKNPHTFWIAQRPVQADGFYAFDVRTGEMIDRA